MTIEEAAPVDLINKSKPKMTKLETVEIWFRPTIQALLEILLMSLPILIWLAVLQSIGSGSNLTWKSPATCFFALSLWLSVTRDTQKAFHREGNDSDKFFREISTAYSLIGVVITAIMLAMSVANSAAPDRYILNFHALHTQVIFYAGCVSALTTKTILIQRKDYKFYF